MRPDLLLTISVLLFTASGCSRIPALLPADGGQPALSCDDVTPEPLPPPPPIVPHPVDCAECEKQVASQAATIEALAKRVQELESAPPVKPTTEADYWDDIAGLVEIGELDDTDDVLNIADILKERGKLTDMSRLDPWQPTMQKITDENRASIAATIRGGD